ncbi:DNA-binding anti-repressor SinI [Virgibacillus soli]|uniref:DNA-binding anti-repressor SinI n=1 Tax=Paracerasibacillus soli TaxID=480284 RepID=A0ABU5CU38_9BACI|nr:DNA-binding anti-repressor SinI [Virgibacillus soli]MDY0408938.1 DNA-binding anti-repressor SinI [Virgibacillus soli]
MEQTITKKGLLDEEWVLLIKKAKFCGFTKEEIRLILSELKQNES